MATEGKRMIALQSSNGEVFKVEAAVAMEFRAIKHMIENNDADSRIPLPNITTSILSKVIEYCTKHVEAVANANSGSISTKAKAVDEELETWDADFVNVDQSVLFDLILAANYLDIQGLLDLTCKTVANMLKGKTPAEIRTTFNIQSDFTPEEEEQIRQEDQWAFENLQE